MNSMKNWMWVFQGRVMTKKFQASSLQVVTKIRKVKAKEELSRARC